jgi:hypothetical protein
MTNNSGKEGVDMRLDYVLNNAMKIHKKPERTGFKKFLKIIKQNQYDPSDLWQASMKAKAIKAGLIDENLKVVDDIE